MTFEEVLAVAAGRSSEPSRLAEFYGALADPRSWAPVELDFLADLGPAWSVGRGHDTLPNADAGRGFHDDISRWVQAVGGGGPGAAYIDTTTLHTARVLVEEPDPERVSAATLLDLNTLVTALTLHERVLVLGGDPATDPWARRINRTLGEDVVIVVPARGDTMEEDVALEGVQRLISDLWWESNKDFPRVARGAAGGSFVAREEVERGWRILLDLDADAPLDVFRDLDTGFDSDWRSLMTQVLTLEEPASAYSMLDANLLASECNLRAHFNLRVAQVLRAVYLPNAARMPYERQYHVKSPRVERHLRSVAALDRRFRERRPPATEGPRIAPLSLALPLPLAAVLGRIDALDQLLGRIAEMRRDSRPLRRALVEQAVEDQGIDGAMRRGLERTSRDTASRWVGWGRLPIAQGAAITGMLGAGAPPEWVLASVAVLTAADRFPAEPIERLVRRVTSPTYSVVQRLAEAGAQVGEVGRRAEALWRLDEGRADHIARRVTALSALEPA